METVLCCDNLECLGAQPDGSIDLIYIDPPFNTGRRRGQAGSVQHYADRWEGGVEEYVQFLAPRLEHMRRILKDSGTIYVHLDWHAVHYVKVLMDRLLGPAQFLNEIIWHYRTGGVSNRRFPRKHDNILAYAKRQGAHTFNPQRGGTYRTDGLNYDDDGRPYKSTRSGRLYFDERGPALTDVWDIPFLSTVAKERTGYPSQKPEALLRRIIAASSNEGDLVADFFCGSGTTLTVARDMGRSCLGCDISPEAVAVTQKRLTDKSPTLFCEEVP